jgi:hypothetical protein
LGSQSELLDRRSTTTFGIIAATLGVTLESRVVLLTAAPYSSGL